MMQVANSVPFDIRSVYASLSLEKEIPLVTFHLLNVEIIFSCPSCSLVPSFFVFL